MAKIALVIMSNLFFVSAIIAYFMDEPNYTTWFLIFGFGWLILAELLVIEDKIGKSNKEGE